MLGLNYLAWLGIVVWVVVPLLAFLTARRLWVHAQSDRAKALALFAGFAILFTPVLISNGVKAYYDRQVRELCAKDGGVRVYETVRLPLGKFNQWRQINFYKPTQGENALGPEYIFKSELTYLRKGNPSLHRYKVKVIRRVDHKVLGESAGYSRGGGDLPGPWQPSSFSCQQEYGDIPLLNRIFSKE